MLGTLPLLYNGQGFFFKSCFSEDEMMDNRASQDETAGKGICLPLNEYNLMQKVAITFC